MMDASQGPDEEDSQRPEDDSQRPEEEVVTPRPSDSKNKSTCLVCGRVVWVGSKDDEPRVVDHFMAYPLDTDWSKNVGSKPYCFYCWEQEVETLDSMGKQHRAKGTKKKSSDGKKKPTAGKGKKKKTTASVKNKKKKPTTSAGKGEKKQPTSISREKMDQVVKASHNRSIATAAAKAAAVVADKQQLGGIQIDIDTALEEAHVVPPAPVPRTPWEVTLSLNP